MKAAVPAVSQAVAGSVTVNVVTPSALEAVIGYLFVTGQRERMEEILKLALEDDHEKR